jgi:acetyltransferase-like isoleucine patch superfamily enzyme
MASRWVGPLAHAASRALRRASLYWKLRPLGSVRRIEIDPEAIVEGIVWLPGSGKVTISRGARLLGGRAPIELRADAGGSLFIGEDVTVESGVSIEATKSVHIGTGARIGAFAKILDNNFHSVQGDRSARPEASPVAIGVGAVVGPRAIVLPGSVIGARSRVGPGRVVSFHIPAGSVLGGAPPSLANGAAASFPRVGGGA